MEDLKGKIALALQSDFIGEIRFDEDEIETMKSDCKRFYRAAQQSYSKAYKIDDIGELIVLIVNLAKSWGYESEERFWPKLFGEVFDDASVSPNKFYDEFAGCLKKHNKVLFFSKENKRMFKEAFLLHAFSPDASAESFVRLLWEWFIDPDIINFDYQRGDPIYGQIAKFLMKKFGGEKNLDDDISFEGKTYAIKSSFKYLFTQDIDNGIKLLDKVFSYFDDLYYSRKVSWDSFIADRCESILRNILTESISDRTRKRQRAIEHIISDYEKIYAAYAIDDEGNASLFIPEIRAIEEEAEDYTIQIYNEDECIYSLNGYIVGSDIRRRIKRVEIPFKSFAGSYSKIFNINVKLFVQRNGNEVLLYDSKQSLYRDFILFKTSREIRGGNNKPGAYYLTYPKDILVEKITTAAVNGVGTFTVSLLAKENDYIATETQQVFFNNSQKDSHIIIDGIKRNNISYVLNGEEYGVYKSVNSIHFNVDRPDYAPRILVTVDGENRYPLTSCSINSGNNFYIDLSKISAACEGCHKILISDIKQKKLLHSVLFYVNSGFNLPIKAGYFIFDNKMFGVKAQKHFGSESTCLFELWPKAGVETVAFGYEDGEILVDLPYIKWRLDDTEWNYSGLNETLWHKNTLLHNNCIIEIENNSTNDIKLYINDSEIKQATDTKYLLGDALTAFSEEDLNEIFMSIGGKKFLLFKVANKEQLEDFDIDYDNKAIDFASYFVGELDARFAVTFDNGEKKYEFETGIKGNIPDCIADDIYDIKIWLLDFWGDKRQLLSLECCIIGNIDKFYFDGFRIALHTFRKPDSGKVKLTNAYIEKLTYLREESLGSVYSGELNYRKKRYNVEVYKRDENSLKFYFVIGDGLHAVNYDLTKNTFTHDLPDNVKIIPCSSCYYIREEI